MKEEEQSVGKLINTRRTELALTQKEVADYVGVSEATVSRWESGHINNMRRDKIASLAKILCISPTALMGIGAAGMAGAAIAAGAAGATAGAATSAASIAASLVAAATAALGVAKDTSESRKIIEQKETELIKRFLDIQQAMAYSIPVLGQITSSADIVDKANVKSCEIIDLKYKNDGFEYFALHAPDKTMEPTIAEGDIVIVRKQGDAEDGQKVVVSIGNEKATIRELRKSEGGITLVGHNVTLCPPDYYSKKSVADLPVKIIGLVIEVRHKLI